MFKHRLINRRVGNRRTPLDQYIRRHRIRARVTIPLAIGILLLLAIADRNGWFYDHSGDWGRYENQVVLVTHVVDGDTLHIDIPDAKRSTTRVRLWGIDTPELANPQQERLEEPFARESAERARQLAQGKRVRLHLEPHSLRGRYGRLLAYVELPDGTLLNERLVAEGWARADTRFSHRWSDRFSLLQLQAQRDQIGMWAEDSSHK